MLNDVKEETELFQTAIRDKRVSLFENFNFAAQDRKKSHKIGSKKADVISHQQEIDAIFQAQEDSDEGSGTFAGVWGDT